MKNFATHFKSTLAVTLSLLMAVESAQALPGGAAVATNPFGIQLHSRLGQITDHYLGRLEVHDAKPQFILIQNLHVNRSVQRAISGILRQLKEQNLLPETVAAEGATGPMPIESMQHYPDASARKDAADYLVSQGEMPGEMHFMVTEGRGQLVGVETADLYDATLDMYRRSYESRARLEKELSRLEEALPQLKKDPRAAGNASILEQDVAAIQTLVRVQMQPDEVRRTVNQAVFALDHLKAVLPPKTATDLIEPVTAAVNFYALALLRDDALFEHALKLRQDGRQATTVLVMGGFHTPGLTKHLKEKGLSYAVITPNVTRHDAVDEKLYVERMLGRHIVVEQAAQGTDAAAMLAQPPVSTLLPQLFAARAASTWWTRLTAKTTALRPRRLPVMKSAAIVSAIGLAAAAFGQPSSHTSIDPGFNFVDFLLSIPFGVWVALALVVLIPIIIHLENKHQIEIFMPLGCCLAIFGPSMAIVGFLIWWTWPGGLILIPILIFSLTANGIVTWASNWLNPDWRACHRQGIKDVDAFSRLAAEFGRNKIERIAQAVGRENADAVITTGLPTNITLIRRFGIDAFVDIAQNARSLSAVVLTFGLPTFHDHIASAHELKHYAEHLASVAKYNDEASVAILQRGFYTLKSPTTVPDDLAILNTHLRQIAAAAGVGIIRLDGLHRAKGLIERFGLKPFIHIAEQCGKETYVVVQSGLPLVADRIETEDDLAAQSIRLRDIARLAGRDTVDEGLPAVQELVAKFGLDPFVKIATDQGANAQVVIQHGLPMVSEQILDAEDLNSRATTLGNIVTEAGPQVLERGLPARAGLVRRLGLAPFVGLASLYDSETQIAIYRTGLSRFESRIHSAADLGDFVDAMAGIIAAYGVDFFNTGFPISLAELDTNTLSPSQLRNKETLVRGLELALAKIQPHTFPEYKLEMTDPYHSSTFITMPEETVSVGDERHPESGRYSMICAALRKLAEPGPLVVPSSLAHPTQTPPSAPPSLVPQKTFAKGSRNMTSEFLSFLRDNQLGDVVLIGGAPRDLQLKREPHDLDVTFAIKAEEADIARWKEDPTDWNFQMTSILAERIDAVATALGVSTDDFIDGQARFQGKPVHYAGPFVMRRNAGHGSGVIRHQSRLGMVIVNERLHALKNNVSVDALGIQAQGEVLVGEVPAGLEDLHAHRLRLLEPARPLRPDEVVHFLEIRCRLGFSFDDSLESAVRHWADTAIGAPDAFSKEARNSAASLQYELADLMAAASQDEVLAELDRLGITDLLAQTEGDGAERLKAALEARGETINSSPLTRLIPPWASVVIGLALYPARVLHEWGHAAGLGRHGVDFTMNLKTLQPSVTLQDGSTPKDHPMAVWEGLQANWMAVIVLGLIMPLTLSVPFLPIVLAYLAAINLAEAVLSSISYSARDLKQVQHDSDMRVLVTHLREKLANPALFTIPAQLGKDLFTLFDRVMKPSVKDQVAAVRERILASA